MGESVFCGEQCSGFFLQSFSLPTGHIITLRPLRPLLSLHPVSIPRQDPRLPGVSEPLIRCISPVPSPPPLPPGPASTWGLGATHQVHLTRALPPPLPPGPASTWGLGATRQVHLTRALPPPARTRVCLGSRRPSACPADWPPWLQQTGSCTCWEVGEGGEGGSCIPGKPGVDAR